MNEKLTANETVFLKLSDNGQLDSFSSTYINRGFFFGDGLFESMIFANGKIRYKDSHISRLKMGCKMLHLDVDNLDILDKCEIYLNENLPHINNIRIRWNIYREGMGRYTPETNLASHFLMLQKYQYLPPTTKKAYINKNIKVPTLPWSNCKTLNSMVYVMANLERKNKPYDEVILLNSDGYICEAGASNLFWIKDSVYYTPSLRSNCIAGIGREAIIQELKNRKIELIMGEFSPKDLLSADQVFTSNVTGIHYISQIDIREFETNPLPFIENLFID